MVVRWVFVVQSQGRPMHWFRADNEDANNICHMRSQLLHWGLTFSGGPQSARSLCYTKEDGGNARRCSSRGDGHAGPLCFTGASECSKPVGQPAPSVGSLL